MKFDISRGNVLVKAGEQPLISRSARASVVWMTDAPLVVGKLYNVKFGTQTIPAKVAKINYRTNVNTLEKTEVLNSLN